ncbi:hypothetical protein F4861DRAFT_131493 [Xylaria intraflava]|nr:hypothetical protein F4861DRAFT_131493 [Xylaria intraflava]
MKQQRKILAPSGVKSPKQNASSSISSFARVSKTVGAANVKELGASTPKKTAKCEAIAPASRKRKVVASDGDDSSADERPRKLVTPTAKSAPAQPVKRGHDRSAKKARPAPKPLKRARSPSASDSDASSIGAKSLFKKLRLDSSPSRSSSPVTADTSIAGSDVETDANPKPDELPEEILSLISLHTAILRALTLHYAHNGSNVPVDLCSLCPDVARAWGKKKVTAADIRTCLGVQGKTPSATPLSLSNYGRGKICIEVDRSGPLNEDKLNALFRANITALWTDFLASDADSDVTAFLPTLPKAPVALCESVVKASPLLLKGQRRLEDLKQGIAVKKMGKDVIAKPDTPVTNADGSKMSLLDRIRLKALQKAALPAGLSPAQLERRAALQRVEEVSALLGMLSRAAGDGGRVSFTMAALLEKLKDSFRMGISRQEGAVCVRLLAAEVAPEWIRVVTLSGRENVVVEVACQVGKPEVARRVQDILGRE